MEAGTGERIDEESIRTGKKHTTIIRINSRLRSVMNTGCHRKLIEKIYH